MRKWCVSLVIFILIMALSIPAAGDVIVFVSRKSTRYHTSCCRFLKKSITSLPLEEARKWGYKPCKVCKPPQ